MRFLYRIIITLVTVALIVLCANSVTIAQSFSQRSHSGIVWNTYYISEQLAIGKLGVNKEDSNNYANRAAWLEIGRDSTNKGLLLPRVVDTVIVSPAKGLVIYRLIDSSIYVYTGLKWNKVGSSGGGSTGGTYTFGYGIDTTTGVVKIDTFKIATLYDLTQLPPSSTNIGSSKLGNQVSVTSSSGTGTNFSVADQDSLITNELQTLSRTGNTAILSNGGGNIALGDTILPTERTNWNAAYNDKVNSLAVTGTNTKTIMLTQQDGGTVTGSFTDLQGLSSETDPIYTASPAFGVTNTRLQQWDTAYARRVVNQTVTGTTTKTITTTLGSGETFVSTWTDLGITSETDPLSPHKSDSNTTSGYPTITYLQNNYQPLLAYTPENVANKVGTISTPSNTDYPNTKAVINYVTGFGYQTQLNAGYAINGIGVGVINVDTPTLDLRYLKIKDSLTKYVTPTQLSTYAPTLQQVTTAGSTSNISSEFSSNLRVFSLRLNNATSRNVTLITPMDNVNYSATFPMANGVFLYEANAATLNNKTIDGGTNTLTNIANASLINSTISGIPLGGNLNALTFGASLAATSTTYNGGTANTVNVSSTDKGDITVAGSGNTWTIDNGAVSNAKLFNSTISGVSLGGTLFNLTLPAILGGGTYNGSAALSPTFGTVGVANGGTGAVTLTPYALITGGTTSTGTVQQVGTGTTGQVLVSNGSSALPTWQSNNLQYTEVTGTAFTFASNSAAYGANNATTRVNFTLPTTIAQGTVITLIGVGAAGWQISQNASQVIKGVGATTTTGGTGKILSSNQYNTITLRCVTANTTFVIQSSQGTLTFN